MKSSISNEIWSSKGDELNKIISYKYLDALEGIYNRKDKDLPLKDDTISKGEIYKIATMHKMILKEYRKKFIEGLSGDIIIRLSKELKIQGKEINKLIETISSINPQNPLFEKLLNLLDIPLFIADLSFTEDNISLSGEIKPFFQEEKISIKYPFKMLKDYQASIFLDSLKFIDNGNGKCMINMPTGTGKTRTAMELIIHFIRDREDSVTKKKLPCRVLWIADNKEILDQAQLDFVFNWKYMGDSSVKVITKKNLKTMGNKDRAFILSSFQSLPKNLSELKDINLIVVDEAHHTIATNWKNNLLKIIDRNPGVRLVGLTATPI